MRTLCIVFATFLFQASAKARVVSYGDLMVEDQEQELAGPHRLSVSSGYDVSNPYLNISNLSTSYHYEWFNWLALGVSYNQFFASKSAYNEQLEDELLVFGITADSDRPESSFYLEAAFYLLRGRVNFFALKALPFRFLLKTGPGKIQLKDEGERSSWLWGMESQIYFSEQWGAKLSVDQEMQSWLSSRKNVYRNRVSLGALFAF